MGKSNDSQTNINSISRISEGTIFKGEINSPGDIRIDGEFNGKVISKGRVVVGEKAKIEGDIICDNIDLWGKLEGSIYVKDTLSMKEGCAVKADLHTRRLAVELGAKFNGNCRMLSDGEFDRLINKDLKKEQDISKNINICSNLNSDSKVTQQKIN